MAEPVGGRLSEALRATYRAAGITQEDMAAALGVDQPTVSKWVRGMRRPPLDALPVIERLCDVQKGTILRAAGYVDDDPGDVRLALRADKRLDDTTRRIMLRIYEEAVPSSRGATRDASSANAEDSRPSAVTTS